MGSFEGGEEGAVQSRLQWEREPFLRTDPVREPQAGSWEEGQSALEATQLTQGEACRTPTRAKDRR